MSKFDASTTESTRNDVTPSIDLRNAKPYFDAIIMLAEDSIPASEAIQQQASLELRQIVDAVRTIIGRKLVLWKTRAQTYKYEVDRLFYDTSGEQGRMIHHAAIAQRKVAEETKLIEDTKIILKRNGHGLLLEYVEGYCRDPRSQTNECFSKIDKARDKFDPVARAENTLIDSCQQQLDCLKDTVQLTLRDIDNIKTVLNKKRSRLDFE